MNVFISPILRFLLTIAILYPMTLMAKELHPWEEVSQEDGINVWQRDIPDTSLVAFKGQALLELSIRDIFTVLYDSDHKLELLDKTVEYRLMEIHSKTEFTIYNHIGSPFLLVSDRDVVLRTNIFFNAKAHTIHTPFWNVPHEDMPPRDGIERMEKCKGSWTLEHKGPNKTLVTYEVEADPGGWLPMWVVNIANKQLPHRTISNMRRQAKKTELYEKSSALISEHFDFAGLLGITPPEKKEEPAPTPEKEEVSAAPADAPKAESE